MSKSRKWMVRLTGALLSCAVLFSSGMSVQASDLDDLRGGVAALLTLSSSSSSEIINAMAEKLQLDVASEEEELEESTLVMANVKSALNVRSEASEDSGKVGKLYRDCGGTILERKDGWTKLQSGNIVGWASDEYLLFGEDALSLANDVGRTIATINTEALRVRKEPSMEADVLGNLPRGEIVEVISQGEDGWVCVDYEGEDGWVSADYVTLNFIIDAGETMDEIKAREAAEREAKRHVNYGEYTTDADTTLLLAALIYCEAGGESYEGKVAVGAVVMNRVRSSAYPDSIHGVIYASGQFTPAMSGKVNQVYESGRIPDECVRAAQEALSGVSNVGDVTHFRRNNGRDGIVIGNHVFY